MKMPNIWVPEAVALITYQFAILNVLLIYQPICNVFLNLLILLIMYLPNGYLVTRMSCQNDHYNPLEFLKLQLSPQLKKESVRTIYVDA